MPAMTACVCSWQLYITGSPSRGPVDNWPFDLFYTAYRVWLFPPGLGAIALQSALISTWYTIYTSQPLHFWSINKNLLYSSLSLCLSALTEIFRRPHSIWQRCAIISRTTTSTAPVASPRRISSRHRWTTWTRKRIDARTVHTIGSLWSLGNVAYAVEHPLPVLDCTCMDWLRDTFTSTLLPSVCAAWTAATAVLFQLVLSWCALDGWFHGFDPTTCLMTRDNPAYMFSGLFNLIRWLWWGGDVHHLSFFSFPFFFFFFFPTTTLFVAFFPFSCSVSFFPSFHAFC